MFWHSFRFLRSTKTPTAAKRALPKNCRALRIRSSPKWYTLAAEHPEFFRIDQTSEHGLSLAARHVLPKENERRPQLTPEFTATLLQTAINLHDRQIKAKE